MRVFYKYSISVFRSGCVDGSRASMLHGDRRSMLGPFRWQSVRSDQSIDFTCSTGLASDGTRMLDFQRRGRNFWRILGGRSQQRHRSVVAAGIIAVPNANSFGKRQGWPNMNAGAALTRLADDPGYIRIVSLSQSTNSKKEHFGQENQDTCP